MLLLIQMCTWGLGALRASLDSTVGRITLPCSVYSLKDINKQKDDKEIISTIVAFTAREQRQKDTGN